MIINSSNVGMESARTYRSNTTRKLSITTKIASRTLYEQTSEKPVLSGEDQEKEWETSSKQDKTENARERMQNSSSAVSGRIRHISKGMESKAIEQIRQQCVIYLWRILFGSKRADQLSEEFELQESTAESQQTEGLFMEITASEEISFEEEESVQFSTGGTVLTADGREISFQMNVGMSRRFAQYYKRESKDVVSMCDPLVINLNQDVAGLSDQKFFFDLDCDGKEEEISVLEKGNAFLALDHNKDGKINDGSELFGAQSGDGFSDLARYDEDGNGWIDEADSVFDKLKIWVKDENGEDKLYTLKEKGMGAIYLGSQSTDYMLRSETSGDVNGRIRRSGIFLYENGMAGTIAHIDMAKRAYE